MMIDYTVWAESVFRASWQGALLVFAVWVSASLMKSASPTVKSWLWPLVITKFLLVGLFVLELPVLTPKVESLAFESTKVLGTELAGAELSAQSSPPWQQVLFALWIIGVTVILVKASKEYYTLCKIARTATDAPARVQELFMGINESSKVEIRTHKDVPMPLVFGLRHPLILVPTGIESNFTDEELKMVLTHEIAHVKRKDVVTAFYVFICQTLFFFHPAVWFARREWQLERESACDQYAIEKTNTASRKYADMLIKISAGAQTAPAFALSAVPAAKTLHRRIENMKNTTKKSKMARLGAVAALAVLAAIAMPFAFVVKDVEDAKSQVETSQTQDEKQPEQSLSADEERERLIIELGKLIKEGKITKDEASERLTESMLRRARADSRAGVSRQNTGGSDDETPGLQLIVDGEFYWIYGSTAAEYKFHARDNFVQIVESDGRQYWVSVGSGGSKGEGKKIEPKVKDVDGRSVNVAAVPTKKK